MKNGVFKSLKTQLVFFVIVAIALSSGIVATVIISINYQNTLDQMKTDGISLAKSNAYTIQKQVENDPTMQGLQESVSEMAKDQKLEYCTIIDVNSINVADSMVDLIGESYADDADTQKVINNGSVLTGFWTDDAGKKILDIMVPLKLNVEGTEVAIMDVGLSIEDLTRTLINSIIKNIIISVISIIVFGFIISLFIDRQIISPIRKMVSVARKISKGETDIDINENCNGELCELKESFAEIIERSKEQASVIKKIAHGDFSFAIIPASEKDLVSYEIIRMKNTVNDMLTQVEATIEELVRGNLSVRIKDDNYEGKWQLFASDLNQLMNSLITPLNITAEYINKISHGNIPDKITEEYLGDFKETKNNVNACIDVMNGLINEVTLLTDAVKAGTLDHRSDSSGFTGSWKELILDVNQLVDAFVSPVNLMAEYIDRIGAGEIPRKISDEYYGDFNEIKKSINSCIDGLGGLEEGKAVLERMRRNDYTVKMEGTYNGIFAEMALSINKVGDQVLSTIHLLNRIAAGDLGALKSLKELGKGCDNDTLVPCLIKLIENINALLSEANMLTNAVIDGELNKRSDENQFEGEWKNLVAGMNNILIEVAKPIDEVSSVMNEISGGNLNVDVIGEYKGEFDVLKQATNLTSSRLRVIVKEIADVISQIADGDIAIDQIRTYRGDFVTISTSLNTIIESLNVVLGEINEAADQVSAGSNQVSIGSQTLSQGSTEQASAIQELHASISEIANQTKNNAVNSSQASQISDIAKENAVKGNGHMDEMLHSMDEINKASADISKIIKVIDDIAFQTNILALNAAVEAARAGQHGKGFAVVAEEVRNLAARSAEAARETTELIEGTIHKVKSGTEIANSTAGALKEIVTGIEESAGLVKEIAAASNDQASAISLVNKGLEQVAQVIQNNSATAEESAASSEELSGQAELLKQMVARFRLKNNKEIKQLAHLQNEKALYVKGPKINLDDVAADKY